ncbi:alpha/beta hydrolase fold domain-containing protein [Arcanobacterium haemolyticum]|nr:alpha/beta hydrolase fold domain-containing protein [Arcanobacterium haemolyticum]
MPNKVNVPSLWTAPMDAVIRKQNELAEDVYETGQTLEQMREGYNTERAFWNDCDPQSAVSREADVPTPFGSVKVRMHRPNNDAVLPVIIYIHGGGFVLGNLDTHDRITRKIAAETGAAVIAIDYTLSPEAKFPQAVSECASAVAYLSEHAQEWGIIPGRVSFAGDSGGANLSFATYLWLRDELHSDIVVESMLLFYGAFGLRDSQSMRLFGGAWDGLTEADYAYYLAQYLADESQMRSPYFDVLSADLTGVPPTYIVAAGLDPLRDDSRTLHGMLESRSLAVYDEVPGVIHGFLHHGRMLEATNEVMERAGRFYRAVVS